MNPIQNIALFSKPNSAKAYGVLHELMELGRSAGFIMIHHDGTKGGWTGDGWDPVFCKAVRETQDMAISIGGDGTLLGVSRSLFGWDKPILGVNLGRLGFLTDVGANDLAPMFQQIKAQSYSIEDRILISATSTAADESGLAFNDVVLSKGDTGRLIEFDVFVNGEELFSLRADGLVICTPTGSTAYALSANGPILHPALQAVAIVPLSPHSLTARPITLPSQSTIEIVVKGDSPNRVYCDGQNFGSPLPQGGRLTVRPGATTVRMLHLEDYSFFNTLRQKLNWASPRER